MSTFGSDPGQMRALAHRIDIERQQLQSTFRTLSHKLEGTAWQGPDATSFRERWQAHHHAKLQAAVRELTATAETLRVEALAQERISSR